MHGGEGARIARIALSTGILVIAAVAAAAGNFTDPLWMARAGTEILSGGAPVHADSWSWDPVANPFVPTSPGWQVLLGLGYQFLGITGVYVVGVLAIAFGLGGLSWIAARLGASATAALLALLPVWAFHGAIASRAAFPALVLFMMDLQFLRQRVPQLAQETRWGPTLRLALGQFVIAAIGVWMHASWSLFAPATAAIAGFWLLTSSKPAHWRRWRQLAALSIGLVAGSCVSPTGIGIWVAANRVREQCAGVVLEWSPSWMQDPLWIALSGLIAVYVLSAAALAFRRVENRRLQSTEGVLAILAILSLAASLTTMRFMMQAAILVVPVYAMAIERAWQRQRHGDNADIRFGRVYMSRVMAASFVLLLPLAVVSAASTFPTAHAATTRDLPRGCHLFADYSATNVTLLVRPDVKVWFDGRLDYWGHTRIVEYSRYLGGTNPNGAVPEGTTCVIATGPSEAGLRSVLLASGHWRLVTTSGDMSLWLPASARH